MAYQINLTYFKPSGKYYSEGAYFSEKLFMAQVFDEVEGMVSDKHLPGLARGSCNFIILVDAPDHPNGYPGLVNLTQ